MLSTRRDGCDRVDVIDRGSPPESALTEYRAAPKMEETTPALSKPDFRLPRSHEAFGRARRVIPGGVNSPARAFGAVGGEPPFIESASGAYLHDIDGHAYVDYVGSWGPMILGHVHPEVRAAVATALDHGSSFGAPTIREVEIAEIVVAAVPSIEKVRFVSSGTEATMSAIRQARGVTGRSKIIKMTRPLPRPRRFTSGSGRFGGNDPRNPRQPGSHRGGLTRHHHLPVQ